MKEGVSLPLDGLGKALKNIYTIPEMLLFGVTLLVLVLLNLFVERLQVGDGIIWGDAVTYAYMTQQGLVLENVLQPFAYRVLVPFIAHFIPLPIQMRFELLNSLSIAVIPILLFYFLKNYFPNHSSQCLLAAFTWVTTGLLAVYFFYPVMVDLPLMVFLLLSLGAVHKGQHRRFALFLVLAALTKEIGILVISYHLIRHRHSLGNWPGRFRLAGYYLPGLIAVLLVHILVSPSLSDTYTYTQTALDFLIQKLSWRGILQVILAGFTTYGIVFMVLLLSLSSVVNFLNRHVEVVAYAMASFPFILVGGSNLELFWFYLFPLVYLIFTAVLVYDWERWQKPILIGPLIMVHLFTARFLVLGYPQDLDMFSQLWAYHMTDDNLFRSLTAFLVLLLILFSFIALQNRARPTSN